MQNKQIAQKGLLIAAAFVLSWLEAQFSAWIPFPGMKIGLTNLVVLTALYKLGAKDALLLNVLRIVLAGLSFGTVFSFAYSLAGGMLSTMLMIALKRTGHFGIMGVSILGGVSHNTAQILVAVLLLSTSQITYYLPVLWIAGCVSGLVIGCIGGEILKRLPVQALSGPPKDGRQIKI